MDHDIIDIDDDEDATDNAVPVFVKHTEAMLDEIDRIVSVLAYHVTLSRSVFFSHTAPNVCLWQEEVEMEDVEEPVLDIDDCDRQDPLAVVEYIDDIYRFYKDIEVKSLNF